MVRQPLVRADFGQRSAPGALRPHAHTLSLGPWTRSEPETITRTAGHDSLVRLPNRDLEGLV
jgi:hypothetical protein